MKKENISELVSGIDEKYINEAVTMRKQEKNVLKYVIPAVSVSAAVIVAAFIGTMHFFNSPDDIISNQEGDKEIITEKNLGEEGIVPGEEIATEPALFPEMMISPQWTDKTTPEKYPEISDGKNIYYTQNINISADNTGNELFSGEMTGYDIYEDKTYTTKGTAYEIKNINPECAVAVKIDGEDGYFVYINTEYVPETLRDMIDDLNLRETLSFGKAYSDRYENSPYRTYISRTYEDFSDTIVWDMLLDDADIKNVSYDRYHEKIISLSVDIPLIGYKNIHMGVTKDGYIITNILNTQKCFFIGPEKAEAFGKYIEENVKYTEVSTVTENPDGSIPGKGQGESTSGFNPDAPVQISPPYDPSSGEVPEVSPVKPHYPDDIIVEAETQVY